MRRSVLRGGSGFDAATYNEGFNKGFDEAYNEGFDAGYAEGVERAQRELIV